MKYKDQLVLFNKNLTTHTSSSVFIKMYVQTDESVSNEGGAFKNLFIYVDTCDISCSACTGPTEVIFSEKTANFIVYCFNRNSVQLAQVTQSKVERLALAVQDIFLINTNV